MRLKVKKMILLSICAIMALMVVLGLLFNIIQLSNKGEIADHDNGFTLLSFESDFILVKSYNWGAIVCGVINLLILLSGIVALILIAYSFVKINLETRCPLAVIIIAMVTSFLYLVEGIAFLSICKETYTQLLTKYLHTVSFVPFILQTVLLIAYIVCNKFVKCADNEKPPQPIGAKTSTVNSDINQAANKIELLKQYKELFDSGVITQEEFDAKKKEWL